MKPIRCILVSLPEGTAHFKLEAQNYTVVCTGLRSKLRLLELFMVKDWRVTEAVKALKACIMLVKIELEEALNKVKTRQMLLSL